MLDLGGALGLDVFLLELGGALGLEVFLQELGCAPGFDVFLLEAIVGPLLIVYKQQMHIFYYTHMYISKSN